MASELRKKWDELANPSEEQIENAWKDWSDKFNIHMDGFYVKLFKNFITNKTMETSYCINI